MSSPASAGPAGAHFEGQVGAYYLLSMLSGAEPRGLPGTTIERIEFQRAPEGRPLDDVIVHAHDHSGHPCVLEVQVKRSATFAPTDEIFQAVVAQIAKVALKPDFWNGCYELAIAIAHSSHKISGAYQDVLTWARQLDSAAVFFDRLGRPGSANDDMRKFVHTFRSHLHENGVSDDDETIWGLLRRFQILVFDFTAQGSESEQLAKERAARTLHPADADRAGSLWAHLIELAIRIAASGGDRTRDRLLEDLSSHSYRLLGHRRHAIARAALAEASRAALADIDDGVGGVALTRPVGVAAVHAALDEGRYVEIRGDAGVGKSGILKHFAQLVAAQSQVLVLSPGRTTPRGWTAMRATLGFEGTAPDLLSDLASDGGALLFLDGLEGFDEHERLTVVDLVRAAATVPGVTVIATARRNFGIEEQSWLPSDSLDQLGRAAPVVIDELAAPEIEELRHAAPRLNALLADSHPARGVVRNLYRLARLASRPAGEPTPRTEVEMAQQWWETADGKMDDGRRERARLLKAMATHALSHVESFDANDAPANAVDELVASETLRDLGNDRIAFRHDVLREWAIANVLHSDPKAIEALKMERVASPTLARGVELTARMYLEVTTDIEPWLTWLRSMSREGAHGSWRRSALLSLVRSEIASELLKRTSGALLANDARLLRELIRTVMAVDVRPASKMFAAAGIDPSMIPADLTIPSAPSWHRLILWVLSLADTLPSAAIADVADLYIAWSTGMFGLDQLTPLTSAWLYHWLMEIEITEETRTLKDWREPFGGKLDDDKVRALRASLRSGFLSFCNRTPTLAAAYLQWIGQRQHNDEAKHSILRFRGTLAQAAPAELAELTASILIRDKADEDSRHRREREEPFEFADHELHPPSPAQGPFFELLTHAPQHGLSLVRRLVDHAIAFYSGGRPHGADAITLQCPEGAREFPWSQSYAWSRDEGRHSGLTSALMALEAWAHRRIEAGESFTTVLSDVLGPPGAPAAYLLVAVDLLISHWPKSRDAAIPFVACPELLCHDRVRQANDSFETPDFLGVRALKKEPYGAVNLEGLKRRPSRSASLEDLINHYAVFGPSEQRDSLKALLLKAAERLGVPTPQSTFEDAAFMAAHALNRIEPRNWKEVSRQLKDGRVVTGHEYVSPPAEMQHLQALASESQDRLSDSNLRFSLASALDDTARSSTQLAAAGVAWAQSTAAKPTGTDEDDDWMREQALVAAATIAVRDGDARLRNEQASWARDVFERTLQSAAGDRANAFHSGLRYNPIAMAFAGIAHLLKDGRAPEDRRALLTAAARHYSSAAQGFRATAQALATVDERLPRAVLRVAFAACVRPSREWDSPDEQREARSKHYQQQLQAAVDAELSWLAEDRPEPDWPEFPPEGTRPRRRRILLATEPEEPAKPQRARPEQYVDHQRAALWLRSAAQLFDVAKRPWLRDVARKYADWTATANGAGLDADEEISHSPHEWNDAYYSLVAYCLPGLASPEVDEIVLARVVSLPDEPFFDVLTSLQRNIDEVYFNSHGLLDAEAARIRASLARRLMASSGWRRLAGQRSTSIEIHIAPAIATMFFNSYSRWQSPESYLHPKGIDRLDVFLPTLGQLVASGSSLFVTFVTLSLLEVSPRASHLTFIVNAVRTWMASYPDDTAFWIDHGVGSRICTLIERIWREAPTTLGEGDALRTEVDQLLAALVRVGVPQASQLERALNGLG